MKITIRKFEERDILDKIRWINDERNNQYLHYDLPLEYERTLAWYRKIQHRSDRYDAVIEVDGKAVGIVGLLNIDKVNRKAEYYITLGEQEYKGKGVATKASRMLIDYAFDVLGLQKLYLFTETENKQAQKLFERLGFVKEGMLKNDLMIEGRCIHRYVYGLVKDSDGNLPKFFGGKTQSKRSELSFSPIVKSSISVNGNVLFFKREDLLPFSFGGNKARKGKLFFDDIMEGSYDCVVTYGTSSSNHCRIIANMAASKGLQCYVVSPKEVSEPTSNHQMVQLFGANVILSPLSDVSSTIEKTLEHLKKNGFNPYFIQGGGHGDIGTQSYVECYQEIIEQERCLGIQFDYIVCPSGTGTTQAGLICGNEIFGNNKNIVGISIARKNPYGIQVVSDSVAQYMQSKGYTVPNLSEVQFIDDFVLDGYGSYNKDVIEIIREVLEQDGIALDTTYTGKALWGMCEYLKKQGIIGKNILFIHTGGTPLFFDNLDKLLNDTGA